MLVPNISTGGDGWSPSTFSGSNGRMSGGRSSVNVGGFEESRVGPSEWCFYPWITSSAAKRTPAGAAEAFKEVTPAGAPLSPIWSEL